MTLDMEQTIACLNIELFRRKLAEGNDDKQRAILLSLLAEEETKLAALTGKSAKVKS